MSDHALELDALGVASELAPTLVDPFGTDLVYVVPDSDYARNLKPLFDRALALLLLLVALPILIAALVAVRLQLGAGVLYRQERIGALGRRFTVLKLRTMHHDRRTSTAPYVGPERRATHKTDDDPRHTSVGRFLRKWSIDELPQLLNVLRGDMSLVGPRPELPAVADRFYEPWCHQRHAVRPGLTGPWQISARASRAMHDPESIELDVAYTQAVTWRGDLKILLGTIPAMLGRSKGA